MQDRNKMSTTDSRAASLRQLHTTRSDSECVPLCVIISCEQDISDYQSHSAECLP